jgi:5-methylcytosine-specific restriction endonuclease McrA
MSRKKQIQARYKGLIVTRLNDSMLNRRDDGNQSSEETVKGQMTYRNLLLDDRWKNRRIAIMIRDNNSCRVCGSQKKLQVHHRQYHFITSLNQFKPPWDYNADLLITLCNDCHTRGHLQFKIPNIKIQ